MPSPPAPSTSRWPWVFLAIVLTAHLYLAVRLFPTPRAIIDHEKPVVLVDHAIHLYHGALGARFAREHGTTWGFDPFFMAGYPETPVWDSSSNLSIAFQLAAGGQYSPRAYKIGLFVCSFLVVAFLPAGALAAGLKVSEAALAAALGIVVFWGGFPVTLWKSGLFAFVTASSALGLVLALLLRFDRHPTRSRWAVLTAAGALFLFAHVTAPVMALGGAFTYLLSVVRRWSDRRRRLGGVMLAVVLSLVANAFWVVPLWRFRAIRTEAFSFLTTDSAWFLWEFLRFDPVDGHVTLALLVLGMFGLIVWWIEGERLRAGLFGLSVLLLLVLTGLGSLWSVTKTLEPLRFRVPLALLLTIPAASALVRPCVGLAQRVGGGWTGASLALAAVMLAGSGAWVASPQTGPALVARITRARPLVVGLPTAAKSLLNGLETNTDGSARVLFEDQLRLMEPTDPESTHWTPLLPILLGSASPTFIGGLYQTAFITHHKAAAFGDYGLGDRRIDAWRADELDAYFNRYNIGWVVCWSPLSKYCFDRYARAKLVTTLPRSVSPDKVICRDAVQGQALLTLAGQSVAERYMIEGVGRYKVYRIDRPHSFFLEGQGKVASFDANRVVLSDLVPDPSSNSVLLSLHWLDTWKTDPPLPISPAVVAGDPVPFVRIALKGALPNVILYNGY